MEIAVGHRRVVATRGDIVNAATEAIVNAANSRLAGGGGVDGAIHRAAGPELYELTRPFGGCPTGSAVITGAGRMRPPTRRIVHAVGPMYSATRDAECASLLASAYETSLRLAAEEGLASIAFPAISTGVYGYPVDAAAAVAVGAVVGFLRARGDELGADTLSLVKLVLFSASDLTAFEHALGRASGG